MRTTDQTHHNVKHLRAVLAAATLALLAATVWMIVADHRREWKEYQRAYRDRVEAPERPLRIEQISLPDLKLDYHFCQVGRVDRCTTCHEGMAADDSGAADRDALPQPWASHPRLDLYVGPDSPHPMAQFGCTVCHEGQGSATEFRFASHTPNDMRQRSEWREHHGWFRDTDWDHPMLARRFAESRCLQCHHDVTDLEPSRRFVDPPAPKLMAGYHLIRQHGCFGCHEIRGIASSGESVGPDMRLEPDYAAAAMQLAATEASLDDQQRALARRIADQSGEPTWRRRLVESIDGEGLHPKLSPAGAALVKFLASTPDAPGTMRKVGPSLRDVASRLDFPFLAGWIARPADFRPTTRMPRLFGLHKSLGAKGKAESDRLEAVELQVLAEWLLDVSQPVEPLTISAVGSPDEKRVFAPASAERGRRLLLTQGCLACHQHDDYPESTGAQGPDLSRLGAKYPSAKAAAWLADWLRDPARRSPRTRMPNSQLEPIRLPGESDAAIVSDPVSDLVAYLLGPAGSVFGRSSPVSEADLDELVLAHLTKHYSREQAERILQRGLDAERTDAALGDAVELVGPVSRKKKLRYVARRTVAKRGCFGCHDIPGFELAQPIGPALSDWGRKDESLLAFGRVEQLLADDGTADRAATDPDVGFYLDAVAGHRREGFLWQKLRAPRSFDYDRTVEKDYHQRLKMGQFTLDAQQREAVATFVLGLVAQPPASKYVYGPDPAGRAIAEGRKVLDRHACAECHVLEMDRWRFAYRPGEVAAPRASDEFAFMRPHLSREQLAASMRTDPRGRAQAELLGMPQRSADGRVAEFEGDEEDAEGEPLPMRAFSLWEPAAIAGHPWTVGGPDVLVYDDQITKQYAPWGGAAARLIYPAAVADARAAGVNVTGMEIWGRLPPPLVGEGAKVQTDWLVDYLVDPQPIRPAAILKMPKYVLSADELDKLADFFAARSGVSRIAGVGSVSPGPAGQRDNAMRLITDRKTFCAKCHVIGDYRPGETATTFAPDLQDAGRRLRPEYVRRWLAHPKAVLPYTSMPVNFPPSGDPLGQDLLPGSSAQQIDAVVELLDGYDEYLREKTSIRKRIEVSHD